MTEVWNACREVNAYLAIAVAAAVMYRLTGMLLDPARRADQRARHQMAWFGYIAAGLFLASAGATYYANSATAANYTSGVRTLLHLVALGLCVWWPHPARLPRPGDPDA